MSSSFRVEHDSLGDKQIPADAYWGVHTARAVENFPISGTRVSDMPDLIRALGFVKKAAARANSELGALDRKRAAAIMSACEKLIAGRFHDQFVVDVIQDGVGDLTNMNANEVIANLALEKLGVEKGSYDVLHPNAHVNASQCARDVYPTAVRLALWSGIDRLLASMETLRHGFEAKAEAFSDVPGIGVTQPHGAGPRTLGQVFSVLAETIEMDAARLREARSLLQEINLGAMDVGTGINAPTGYADLVCKYLAKESRIPVVRARNRLDDTGDTTSFVQLSGVLKGLASHLCKTCDDLFRLSGGPQSGAGDILLPQRESGASIKSGGVGAVIPEVISQIACEVFGNDVTVAMACEAGLYQFNAVEPIVCWSLFKSIEHLSHACFTLQVNCVAGIEVNRALAAERARESVSALAALNPLLGYEASALIAKAAVAAGGGADPAAGSFRILTQASPHALPRPGKLTKPLRVA